MIIQILQEFGNPSLLRFVDKNLNKDFIEESGMTVKNEKIVR